MGMYPADLEDELMKTYTLGTELERKVADTVRWIDAALSREDVQAPAILWSGGKDSMVMLDLIRSHMDIRLPVILFREPWWPEKYRFHDRMIAAWNLEVYSPPPAGSFAYEGDDHVVLLARYAMRGDDFVDVPKDVIELDDNRQEMRAGWHCGARILSRPRGYQEWPWDTVFVGHKDCDTDPVLGAIPLHSDFIERPEGTSPAYPLRHWTDKDVWDYIEAMNVPMDGDRYDVVNRRNRADRRYNADWIQACTRCLTTSESATCHCPLWNRQILGARERVAWVPSLLGHNFDAPEFDGGETANPEPSTE